jgi:CRP-like cAMP-binding protein
MLERFQGIEGTRRLTETLADQRLVQHNDAIARRLADIVELQVLPESKQLYLLGEPGNNVLFLVLSGSVDLSIKDQRLATLESGQFVGEFPILNPSLDYTVSVVARERSTVGKVSEQQFLSLASDYPEVWKNMAKELATRLRATSAPKQSPWASTSVKAADLTIGELLRGLTIPQLSKIIATLSAALAAVATAAYKVGTIHLFG